MNQHEVLLHLFQKSNLPTQTYYSFLQFFVQYKTVIFRGIRAWIDGVEGEHADQFTTTTTAQ